MKYIGKKKKANILYSPWMLFLLMIVIILLAKGVWTLGSKYKFSRAKYAEHSNNLKALVNKKINLEHTIKTLGTERGIEQEIRDKFRVAKDGERIIIIIDNNEEKQE